MATTDSLDARIIGLLARDGRLPNSEIARQVGVSEKTVRLRLARLIRDEGLRVVATMDGARRQSRMLFFLHIDPGRRFEVANRLAAMEEVAAVYLATGAFEVVVDASFASDADALAFLVERIEGGEGIRACQSAHIIQRVDPTAPAVAAGRRPESAVAFQHFIVEAAKATAVGELLELTAAGALKVLGADRVLVSLLGPRPEQSSGVISGRATFADFRITDSRSLGLSPGYVQAVVNRVNEGAARGVAVRVVESGLHVYVEDATVDPLLDGMYDLVRRQGYRSLLAVPMRRGGTVVGTINLYFDQPWGPTDEDISVAQAFGDHASLALARLEAPA
jgi:DNA-binding Lrp family transcriptional regulator